jgi:predicted xylose isomerase-like sugar epimerase
MDNVKEAAEQAYATIVTELAAPHFFEKLSAHGFAPRSESEAAEMWAAASKLHVLYTAEQEKAAAAQVSSLNVANKQLDEMLAAAGLGGTVEKSSAFAGTASAAAAKPEIAQAVLMLQAATAAAMQNA